jgi:hypothetical protein
MHNKNDIIEFILRNKEGFQVPLQLLENIKKHENVSPIKKKGRMVNIDKYQTNRVLIDHFYKNISRLM